MLVPITLTATFVEGAARSQVVATLDTEAAGIAWNDSPTGFLLECYQRGVEARLLKHFHKMPTLKQASLTEIKLFTGVDAERSETYDACFLFAAQANPASLAD